MKLRGMQGAAAAKWAPTAHTKKTQKALFSVSEQKLMKGQQVLVHVRVPKKREVRGYLSSCQDIAARR